MDQWTYIYIYIFVHKYESVTFFTHRAMCIGLDVFLFQ